MNHSKIDIIGIYIGKNRFLLCAIDFDAIANNTLGFEIYCDI